MNFSIVVAHDENKLIGGNNTLLWHLPDDLKNFKKLTINSVVIMGRKTYESIGRPLPKRVNVILTKDKDFKVENCLIYHSIGDIIRDFSDNPKVFVIGGGEIYKLFLPYVKIIYVSLVEGYYEGDTYFPEYNENWKCLYNEQREGYKFQTWVKKC
jgi:dihydrofolate reductase